MRGEDDPVDSAAFDAEGRRLWLQVREELGPDYEVGYAVSDPDPNEPDRAIKRIIWSP